MRDFRRLLLLFTELVALTRFTLFIGAVPLAALLVTAQGHDLLAGLVEGIRPPLYVSGRGIWLIVAMLVFGGAAWYWAQKSLIPFKVRLSQVSPTGWLGEAGLALQDWYPRALAILPMALVALYSFVVGYIAFALWVAAAAAFMTLFFVVRRPTLRWCAKRSLSILAPIANRPHQERADSLRDFYSRRFAGAHFWLALSLILTVVFAVGIIPRHSPDMPQALGTPAIAFLWAAAAIPAGTVIAVAASAWRKPLLLMTALGVTLVSCLQSDLNAPRALRAPEPDSDDGARRLRVAIETYGSTDLTVGSVEDAAVSRCGFPQTAGTEKDLSRLSRLACTWLIDRLDRGAKLSRSENGKDVLAVVLVSAEGGGIRAALWTAAGLARLRDRTETNNARPGGLRDRADQNDERFADRIFAMSGASGGSLGIGVFTAMQVDDYRCGLPKAPAYERTVQMLSDDFLAPTVAGYLFTDLVRPVLPRVWLDGDRVAYLERSWEKSYGRTYQESDPKCVRNAMSRPFDELWNGGGTLRVPLLFFNTTQVHDGRRAVLAPAVSFGRPNWAFARQRDCAVVVTPDRVSPLSECFLDGLENAIDVVELIRDPVALSTAIGLSARFPYVTSVANITARDTLLRQLADGGYFDNSATITLREIIDLLPTRVQRLGADGKPAFDALGAPVSVPIAPLVLHFVNDPDPAPTAQSPGSVGTTQALAPLQTLDSARSARNFVARIALHERVEARGGYFIQINMQGQRLYSDRAGGFAEPKPDRCDTRHLKESPPLGWVMSKSMRELVLRQVNDERALACLDNCVDWAMGVRGATCMPPTPRRPQPIEIETKAPKPVTEVPPS